MRAFGTLERPDAYCLSASIFRSIIGNTISINNKSRKKAILCNNIAYINIYMTNNSLSFSY